MNISQSSLVPSCPCRGCGLWTIKAPGCGFSVSWMLPYRVTYQKFRPFIKHTVKLWGSFRREHLSVTPLLESWSDLWWVYFLIYNCHFPVLPHFFIWISHTDYNDILSAETMSSLKRGNILLSLLHYSMFSLQNGNWPHKLLMQIKEMFIRNI